MKIGYICIFRGKYLNELKQLWNKEKLEFHGTSEKYRNHRFVRTGENTVTFSVKDYKKEGKWKELTLPGVEFIRRFLMHVPPKRFVRIRHYGLLASRIKAKKLSLYRNLLGCKKYISVMREMTSQEMLKHLWGIDVCCCKTCGGHLVRPQRILPQRN